MTEYNIPNTVTTIGDVPFVNAGNVTISFGQATITSIGTFERVLDRMSGNVTLIIQEGTTTIPNKAFYDETTTDSFKITNIILPSTLQTIGNYAFGKIRATSVVIPEGVTTIGENAFANATIQSISLPSTLTTLGNNAFSGCASLKTIQMAQRTEQQPAFSKTFADLGIGSYTWYNSTGVATTLASSTSAKLTYGR